MWRERPICLNPRRGGASIPAVGCKLRANTGFRQMGRRPSGCAAFARRLRCLGEPSPLRGLTRLNALPIGKIPSNATHQYL